MPDESDAAAPPCRRPRRVLAPPTIAELACSYACRGELISPSYEDLVHTSILHYVKRYARVVWLRAPCIGIAQGSRRLPTLCVHPDARLMPVRGEHWRSRAALPFTARTPRATFAGRHSHARTNGVALHTVGHPWLAPIWRHLGPPGIVWDRLGNGLSFQPRRYTRRHPGGSGWAGPTSHND